MATNVHKNDDKNRFEISVDGELAGYADYTLEDKTYVMLHTEVFDRFGRSGVGSQLVVESLKIIREEGGQVLPHCPFIPTVITKHPEFIELVPESERSRFGLSVTEAGKS